ncbi:MAG: phosphoribosylformylglycinamidine synthase I [archaeon]|jgi:phosphoribosylformylglycinamidine synthase|nr:phosphoribosylformylglycinamidine synthase I [archaeon]
MVNALVLTGYGVNCDEETAFSFKKAGADAKIVHVNDLIKNPGQLKDFQIFAFPGGFSYGDDTGSGNALANKMRNLLWQDLMEFVDQEKLIIGICNGFQVIANLGLLPEAGGKYGERTVALAPNNSARYECRWVSLKGISKKCVFTKGIDGIRMPVAHGEGKFTASKEVLDALVENDQVVFKYAKGSGLAEGEFPFNPNGSVLDIAGICNETGRILGLMPHPERNIFFTQQDDWTKQKEVLKRKGEKLPVEGAGMKIFRNAVAHFK